LEEADDAEDEEDDGPMVAPLDPWAGLPYTIDLETGESLSFFSFSHWDLCAAAFQKNH
jgi:hypothetical protein